MLDWLTLKHKLLPTGGSSRKRSGALNSRSPQQLIVDGRAGREGLRRFLGGGWKILIGRGWLEQFESFDRISNFVTDKH